MNLFNKTGKIIVSLIICFLVLSPAVTVSAENHLTSPGNGNGEATSQTSSNNNTDATTGGFFDICTVTIDGDKIEAMPLSQCFPLVFNRLLAALGLLAMGILVFAGYTYMMAGGDGTKIATAKRLVQGVLTGILVLAISYIFLRWLDPSFVSLEGFDRITDIEVGDPGGGSSGNGSAGGQSGTNTD